MFRSTHPDQTVIVRSVATWRSRTARAVRFAPLVLATLLASAAQAETCRFTGSSNHDGHLTARSDVTQADGLVTVDVTLDFRVSAWVSDYRYLGQEISTWRGTELVSLAVNQRSFSGRAVVRQQWDVFKRRGSTLEASRVQAKRLAEFAQRHPGFMRHWPAAAFGQGWLGDYPSATPERRPDLDLPASGTKPPLAFAFYWSRFLPRSGGPATLILPSLKQNKTVPLTLLPATTGDGWARWSADLRHPGLTASPVSTTAAWVSPDHHLLQLGFDIYTDWASGHAVIRAEGCQGVEIAPDRIGDSP